MTAPPSEPEAPDPLGENQPLPQSSADPADCDAKEQLHIPETPRPMAESLVAAGQQIASAPVHFRQPQTGPNSDDPPMARQPGSVEDIHRTTSSPSVSESLPADIMARIERLETWIATNRLT
jgi:hypothetical protein